MTWLLWIAGGALMWIGVCVSGIGFRMAVNNGRWDQSDNLAVVGFTLIVLGALLWRGA